MKVAIDPSLLIWDHSAVTNNKIALSNLAAAAVDMYSLIEEYGLKVIVDQNMLNELLASFPCSQLAEHDEYFGDFIRSTMSFVGRLMEEENASALEFDNKKFHLSAPPIIKPYFSPELVSNVQRLLAGLFSFGPMSFFISDITSNDGTLKISSGDDIVAIDMVVVFSFSQKLISLFGRIYELNPKHHHTRGWRSRLPSALTNDDLQLLLDNAQAVGNFSDNYVVFSNKADCFLRYRRHQANKFHAYPIEAAELENIKGITVDSVPMV